MECAHMWVYKLQATSVIQFWFLFLDHVCVCGWVGEWVCCYMLVKLVTGPLICPWSLPPPIFCSVCVISRPPSCYCIPSSLSSSSSWVCDLDFAVSASEKHSFLAHKSELIMVKSESKVALTTRSGAGECLECIHVQTGASPPHFQSL